MTYLKLSLLSFSLAALILGCSESSNDKDPLVPGIKAIQITNYEDNTTTIRSLSHELQLDATIIYTNGESSTSTSQLDWDSNDTDDKTSSIIVLNGLCSATKNHGAELISASYRETLYTKDDERKLITIDPLATVTITHESIDIKELNVTVGGTYQFSTKGNFESNDTIKDISSNIIWTSSNVSIATISSTGTITPLENGIVDINVSVFSEINNGIELNVTK